MMRITFLDQAKSCGYYVDGFGPFSLSAGAIIASEQHMWYFLLKAAEAGEL